MGKVFTGIFAALVSFLPFVSAILFFTGDKFHETRIGFWDHDSSMFPESVAEKISMGAEVISTNTYQSVAVFSLSVLVALLIILWSFSWIEKLGSKLNPTINRWVSKLFSKNDNEEPNPSDSEIVIFAVAIVIFSGVVISIAFSFLVFWSSSASKNLALNSQSKLLSRYECSLEGKEVCKKEGLSTLRVSKFTLKDENLTGFAVECSPSNCILYSDKKKVVGVPVSAIKSRETIAPSI